jgi:hypothetical protein
MLALELDRIGDEVKKCRKKVIDLTKSSMATYLSATRGKCYKLSSAQGDRGFELNNMYNFVCSFYLKDSKKGNVITTVFIFKEMADAELTDRDLLNELHTSTILAAPGFSHDGILQLRISDLVKANTLVEQKKLKAAAMAVEKQHAKALSDQAKLAQSVAISKLSFEEQIEHASDIAAAKRVAFQAVDGQAAGSDSDSSSDGSSSTSDSKKRSSLRGGSALLSGRKRLSSGKVKSRLSKITSADSTEGQFHSYCFCCTNI